MPDTPPIPANFEEFQARVDDVAGTDRMPSVAYGISRGAKLLFLGAAGFADRDRAVRATPETRYALASVTKPLTATLVAILAQRGLIDLDRSVNAQLGESKIQGRACPAEMVTVRQLADHTSGLAMHYQFYYADEPYPRQGVEMAMKRYAKTFIGAGFRHVYSNLGYGIIEHLLEHVSGTTLADLMEKELFQPLGMESSSLGKAVASNVALAYGPDGVAYPGYDFDHRGGSAAFGSVRDLLAFGQFHLHQGPNLLDPKAIDSAHKMSTVIGGGIGYGLGWGVNANRYGFRSIHHTGFMGGVSTLLRIIPELDLTIAILTNGQSNMTFPLSDSLVGAVSEAYRGKLAEPKAEPQKIEPQPVPDHAIGSYLGHIESHEEFVPMSLKISSGAAVATIGGVEYPVEGLQGNGIRVQGISGGDLRAEDAAVRPYRLHFDLFPHSTSDRLMGTTLAMSQGPENSGGAKAIRYGSALAFWTELRRVE